MTSLESLAQVKLASHGIHVVEIQTVFTLTILVLKQS